MVISISYEDKDSDDLFIQHLAEQNDTGIVEDWLWTLIYAEFKRHPDFRVCSNDECEEPVNPILTIHEVRDDSWKRYRVRTAPSQVCPRCGALTKMNEPKPAEFYKTEYEYNRAFREGRVKHPPRPVIRRS